MSLPPGALVAGYSPVVTFHQQPAVLQEPLSVAIQT